MITEIELLKQIKLGENSKIEFKSAKGGLPKSIWESVSAFANTNGEYIILGVKEENGKFTLDSLKNSSALIKDFWNLHNSSQKLSSPVCSEDDIALFTIDGNEILVIYIPIAPRKERPIYINGNPYLGTYKRNNDGDYRCTKSEIRQMIRDASDESQDFGIIENFTLEDIDTSTLNGYRNRFRSVRNDHPYTILDDKESSVLEAFPYFHLDYQEKLSNNEDERWSHRITDDGTWVCNLFNFYYRVYNRLVQEIEVPFVLDENGTRLGETHVHEAIREVLINSLVHADYQSSKSITIKKTKDYFFFRNPGRLRITLEQIYQGGISDVRNTYIQRIFQFIGLGEKAGTGFVKILRAWDEQSWMRPQVSEDTIMNMTSVKLTYKVNLPKEPSKDLVKDLKEDLVLKLNHNQIKIIELISDNPKITQTILSKEVGINEKNIRNNIKKLKDLGMLTRIGSPKSGHWKVKL